MFVILGTAIAYKLNNPAYIFFGSLFDNIVVFMTRDALKVGFGEIKRRLTKAQ